MQKLLKMLGDEPGTSTAGVLSAVVSGAIMGYVIYRTARYMEVDSPKARGIAVTVGVTTALGQIANGWLSSWIDQAKTPPALAGVVL